MPRCSSQHVMIQANRRPTAAGALQWHQALVISLVLVLLITNGGAG